MTDVRLRPLRIDGDRVHPDDVAASVAVFAAFETDRMGTPETTLAEAEAAYAGPRTVRDECALLLVDDEPVGGLFVFADPRGHDVYVDVAVLPGRDDERELLGVLLDQAAAAARRIADADGGEGWTLRTGHAAGDTVLVELLTERGLAEVRRFYRMRIPSDSPAIPAEAPPVPEGVELVVRDDEETHRAIWTVDNEAFLDHWNFTPMPYDDWWAELSSGSTRDPAGWFLLRVDGEPAAMLVMDHSQAENGDGYVAILGVRRPWRGRGLATWLLQTAFVRDRERGRAGTQLSVDAENLTGAVRLYEAVGMSPVHVRHGWAVDL